MDVKYSLKGSHISPAAHSIRQELHDLGFQVTYLGTARSYDGEYNSSIIINAQAFEYVCEMLYKTRKELQMEREKKWWKFWK